MMLKKIVIIGPESTGKSSLCKALATHYNCYSCPEYARQYLNENGTQYVYEDLEKIAKGQLELENNFTALSKDKPFLFIDTDMYVMKVWYEYVFDTLPPFISKEINTRPYDLYLLCKPDLPWTHDNMREYPDEKIRIILFEKYHALMLNQQTPFYIIEGIGNTRTENAIRKIDSLF